VNGERVADATGLTAGGRMPGRVLREFGS